MGALKVIASSSERCYNAWGRMAAKAAIVLQRRETEAAKAAIVLQRRKNSVQQARPFLENLHELTERLPVWRYVC